MRLQDLDVFDQASHVPARVADTNSAHNKHHFDKLLIDVRQWQIGQCHVACFRTGVTDELRAARAGHVSVRDQGSLGLEAN
jgi:hypothetical protein